MLWPAGFPSRGLAGEPRHLALCQARHKHLDSAGLGPAAPTNLFLTLRAPGNQARSTSHSQGRLRAGGTVNELPGVSTENGAPRGHVFRHSGPSQQWGVSSGLRPETLYILNAKDGLHHKEWFGPRYQWGTKLKHSERPA